MFDFFDFLYVRLFEYYKKHSPNGNDQGVSALISISALQAMNLLSIFFAIGIVTNEKTIIKRVIIIPLAIIILILNGFYYNRRNFKVLSKELSANKRGFSSKLLLSYGVLSILLFFSLAIVLGTK